MKPPHEFYRDMNHVYGQTLNNELCVNNTYSNSYRNRFYIYVAEFYSYLFTIVNVFINLLVGFILIGMLKISKI